MTLAGAEITKSEYIRALQAIDIFGKHEVYRKLLVGHYGSPNRTTSATNLGQSAGLGDGSDVGAKNAVNLRYGTLGKWLCDKIDIDRPRFPIEVMFDHYVAAQTSNSGDIEYEMADGLAMALEELGLVVPVEGESGQQLEGAVELESISAVEGKSRLAVHKRRERNSDLIRKKKSSVESLVCEACGINTEDVYGVDCSEVHHKFPIGEMDSEALTTLDDLQIVCPTCHRVIHKRKCSVGDLMNSLASKGLLYKDG